MKKFLGYFLSPLATIAFLLMLVIFQPIQWMCYNWGGYKVHKRSVDILNFFLVGTYYILFNPVKFTNKQNLPLSRSIIFIANHQSDFDIPPMIYFLRKYHAKFISKVELTKGIPSISYNLKVGGGANIDRKDARQSITELVKFGIRMKENKWSAMIFPEGTRSKDGKVKTFQSAGVAALLKKCPDALLVPVAIKDSWKMRRYGLYPLNTFTPMSWTVLEPIEPGKTPVDELVKQIEERIRAVVD
ncbi:lysophospholipid acyltransferase family protein [Mucilaginibacter psychrotolerans]|uniref:1-acyl-sn-glycerol-3-phosphate acyltransferase n=1 Tax=Mucilaginibacter psychrotolerans TaxID=1524096 RepID=A0A4Y8S435_9SPHI|nr:lysophospholipid acyltransferase family protein [Mucilaginibacter psychrotolerans]TFF33693.1 1-acyl-sn-glycerol-3-phosphate acyltransferase [Mucilaginibacter psychrotolerans]